MYDSSVERSEVRVVDVLVRVEARVWREDVRGCNFGRRLDGGAEADVSRPLSDEVVEASSSNVTCLLCPRASWTS